MPTPRTLHTSPPLCSRLNVRGVKKLLRSTFNLAGRLYKKHSRSPGQHKKKVEFSYLQKLKALSDHRKQRKNATVHCRASQLELFHSQLGELRRTGRDVTPSFQLVAQCDKGQWLNEAAGRESQRKGGGGGRLDDL